MNETIFDAVTRDMDHVSQWFTHDDATPITTEGTSQMSVLTDMHNSVALGLANIKDWAEGLEARLPAIADRAAKLDQSPIVQALDELAAPLPAEVEQAIASLIRHSSTPPRQPAEQPVPVPAVIS